MNKIARRNSILIILFILINIIIGLKYGLKAIGIFLGGQLWAWMMYSMIDD